MDGDSVDNVVNMSQVENRVEAAKLGHFRCLRCVLAIKSLQANFEQDGQDTIGQDPAQAFLPSSHHVCAHRCPCGSSAQ